VKQTDLHKDPDLKTYFMKELAGQSQRIQKVLDKAVEKGKPEVQKVWVDILASGVGKKQDEGSTIEVVNERTPGSRTKFENS
jgi:Zn finger protein HypA/HybF involved in hydrogenase expression